MNRRQGRYIAGLSVLVLFQLAPLMIPVVWYTSWSVSAKSIVSGLLALGIPEIGVALAVLIIGRAEVKRIWRIVKIYAKRCYR